MITEDYVSFEIAKLLKEKGFDCLCHSYFRKDNPNNLVKETCGANWNDAPFFTSRPTLQMAMKWFREVHNVVIVIDVCRETEREGFYCWQLEDNHTGDWIENIVGECPTYEEACEEAIKYCLENLI